MPFMSSLKTRLISGWRHAANRGAWHLNVFGSRSRLEIGNWKVEIGVSGTKGFRIPQQYKSMKAKFPISIF